MTPTDTSALRTLMEEATPGPWDHYQVPPFRNKRAYMAIEAGETEIEVARYEGGHFDAAYIVALVNAAPGLLNEADAYVRVMALLDGAHVLPQSQVHQALAIPGKPVEALKALEDADDDLLNELDQLRKDNAVLSGQVARVEAWYGWRRGTDVLEAIAIPTEGGE